MSDQHRIVINGAYGGFCLSDHALQEYNLRATRQVRSKYMDIERDDPVLVQIVEELGPRANGMFAKLRVVGIPAQYTLFYTIQEYDGKESIEIKYDAYKISASKAILRDVAQTKAERITRALAVLDAPLDPWQE